MAQGGARLGGTAMKARFLLSLLAIALIATGLWLTSHRRPMRARPAEVTIQDGKTIDFSSGKPVIKADAEEKAKIQQGVDAINSATANVTFAPAAVPHPAPAPDKK